MKSMKRWRQPGSTGSSRAIKRLSTKVSRSASAEGTTQEP